MPRKPISVLIHTLNEVDLIEECIRSVAWADEIYLLDSFSSDGTPELVREKFPEVVVEQRESLGSAAQKNYGMERVSHDWMLVVDADERVTPELRDEILALLEGEPDHWGYSIGRRNFILGREVRHSGLQRDRVIRFFNREHARYPNRRVHAEMIVEGSVGPLRDKLLHHYIRSFDHMAEKMTRYGIWAAAQMYLDKRRISPLDVVLHPLWRFFRDYFMNLGFLDGIRGLVVVGMHTYYTFLKYAKAWELQLLDRRGEQVDLPRLDADPRRWLRPWEEPRNSRQ